VWLLALVDGAALAADWNPMLPMGSNVGRTVTEHFKVTLLLASLVLLVIWPWLTVAFQGWSVRRLTLGLLVLLSMLNYTRWGSETLTSRLDCYDVMHYYLNAKYFDELGYLDLYPAALLADDENDGPRFDNGKRYMAQDATGHAMQPISHALARGRWVRDNQFTPERWEAFTHDFLVLQRQRPREWSDPLWRQMIQDHGFNGTTAWVFLARPITNIPIEYIKALCWIDLILLGLGTLAVGWAYGVDTALWVILAFCTGYSARWPTLTWAFMRYDWVFSLLMTMALLKKRHHLWAGLFAGHAAVLRFFPAIFMWGPFTKGLVGLRTGLNKPLLLFAAGFLVAVAALQGGAFATMGTEPAQTHFENMLDHNKAEQLSSRRIGFALAMTYDGELEPKLLTKERKAIIGEQKPLRLALGMVFLVAFGLAGRHLSDDESYAYGFFGFFLLTTASYYYYIARLMLVVAHAGNLHRTRDRFGLAILLAIEAFCSWAEVAHPGYRSFLIGHLAWALSAYALVMLGLIAWSSRHGPEAEATEAPT
jgi:hypothetical protein